MQMMTVYSALLMLVWLSLYLFANIWLRLRFVADGFLASGSYDKKKKKYREAWSSVQRFFLVPMFSMNSRKKFFCIAVMNYVHLIVVIIVITEHIIGIQRGRNMPDELFWQISDFCIFLAEVALLSSR